jgi:spore germination protein (amino acid permease)
MNMKVSIQPKPQHTINAILLIFIVHSMQLGVGIQGFQRIVYTEAKHDAWISVIVSGVASSLIAFLMVRTLKMYKNPDIYGIHYDLLGKWVGMAVNLIYVSYCLGAFLVIIRNYIEVIQAWVFPEVPTWFLAFTLILLVLYGVLGGIRIVVGVSFFSVFLALWMLLLLGYPLQFINWQNIIPFFESSYLDILKGAYTMTFTVIGFEIIYSFYPNIKEKNKTDLYIQIGLIYTTLLYTVIMLVSLSYFSGGQLERTIWGTLTLFKIVRLPFIERFEYVAVTFWMLIILPNLMLYLWSAARGMARIFKKKEKTFILIFASLLFFLVLIFVTRDQINSLNDQFAKIAFYVVYCYPILLYLLVVIKKKILGRKEERV